MRPKTIDMVDKHLTWKENPGPGQYDSVDLDPRSGRFMVSKFNDSKFGKMTNNVPRFRDSKETPGPASYLELDSLSPTGKYVSARRTGTGSRIFNQTARTDLVSETLRKKNYPGPGQYD